MTRIAFICTGNSCRSQIAEGFARTMAKEDVEVYSAGVSPIKINPRAIASMKNAEIDISSQRSKKLSEIPKEIDYVITVCSNAEKLCADMPAKMEKLHWDIPEPIEDGGEVLAASEYRRVREMVRVHVQQFLKGRNLLKT